MGEDKKIDEAEDIDIKSSLAFAPLIYAMGFLPSFVKHDYYRYLLFNYTAVSLCVYLAWETIEPIRVYVKDLGILYLRAMCLAGVCLLASFDQTRDYFSVLLIVLVSVNVRLKDIQTVWVLYTILLTWDYITWHWFGTQKLNCIPSLMLFDHIHVVDWIVGGISTAYIIRACGKNIALIMGSVVLVLAMWVCTCWAVYLFITSLKEPSCLLHVICPCCLVFVTAHHSLVRAFRRQEGGSPA